MDKSPAAATGAQNDVTLSIVPPLGKEMRDVGQLAVDRISPDGSAVLFRASDRQALRSRAELPGRAAVAGISRAGDALWAPDSKSVAFPTANGLMKIRLPKGAPEVVTTKPVGRAAEAGAIRE